MQTLVFSKVAARMHQACDTQLAEADLVVISTEDIERLQVDNTMRVNMEFRQSVYPQMDMHCSTRPQGANFLDSSRQEERTPAPTKSAYSSPRRLCTVWRGNL
eukprot:240041-Pleurochrysis_carterae.AAC.1